MRGLKKLQHISPVSIVSSPFSPIVSSLSFHKKQLSYVGNFTKIKQKIKQQKEALQI